MAGCYSLAKGTRVVVTHCALARALRGTRSFRQALAPPARRQHSPRYRLHFQIRAWAEDTQSPHSRAKPSRSPQGHAAWDLWSSGTGQLPEKLQWMLVIQ